ncbi:hypothetical protein DXJ88_23015 [Vibrio parahaemolyticus]|nr:hypothetical protein DXJ88_23015 [Vibrio parahaemolyticus]TPA97709.1 hypothetical protein DXJ72_22980 [Vibrio parahaemolyticus]TPD11266.1 hypothetical protein DXJ73_23025 [Vibrio parahaemolyticus]
MDICLIEIVKVPIFDNIIIYAHMFNVYTNKHVCILTIQTPFGSPYGVENKRLFILKIIRRF